MQHKINVKILTKSETTKYMIEDFCDTKIMINQILEIGANNFFWVKQLKLNNIYLSYGNT